MAAVLFMVGKGEEDPDIVKTLLDMAACPRKPQVLCALHRTEHLHSRIPRHVPPTLISPCPSAWGPLVLITAQKWLHSPGVAAGAPGAHARLPRWLTPYCFTLPCPSPCRTPPCVYLAARVEGGGAHVCPDDAHPPPSWLAGAQCA